MIGNTPYFGDLRLPSRPHQVDIALPRAAGFSVLASEYNLRHSSNRVIGAAMPVLFLEYPKCSTCKKAKKWLDEHGVDYIDRDIVTDNPTAAELAEWRERGDLPVRKLFNTSGVL